MEQLEAPIHCRHCGNIGICQVRASYTYEIDVNGVPDDTGYVNNSQDEQRMWFLFQCTACSRPILAECVIPEQEKFGEVPEVFKYGIQYSEIKPDFPVILFDEHSPNERILYPQKETGKDDWIDWLPSGVERAYRSALKVQTVDAEAFAIMVGRTLEEICDSEKATGNRLVDKIKSLANSGRIPQVLADMFTQLRLLRNLAAHADTSGYTVTERDVPIIREFLDAILEYLYIAKRKIDDLERRIKGEEPMSWII